MTMAVSPPRDFGAHHTPGVYLHLDEEGYDFYIEVAADAKPHEWELAVSTAEALGYELIPEWRHEFTFPDDEEDEAVRFHLIPKESSDDSDD